MVRYPLSQLYYLDKKREPLDGPSARGGTVRAILTVSPNQARQHVACFGLNMFWSGSLTSNDVVLK